MKEPSPQLSVEEAEKQLGLTSDKGHWKQQALNVGLNLKRAEQMTIEQLKEYWLNATTRQTNIDLLVAKGFSPESFIGLSLDEIVVIRDALSDSNRLAEILDTPPAQQMLQDRRQETEKIPKFFNQFEIENVRQNLYELVRRFEHSYRKRSQGILKVASVDIMSTKPIERPAAETMYREYFSIRFSFSKPEIDHMMAESDWRFFHTALCAHLESLGLTVTHEIRPSLDNYISDITVALLPTELMQPEERIGLRGSIAQALLHTQTKIN